MESLFIQMMYKPHFQKIDPRTDPGFVIQSHICLIVYQLLKTL